MKTEKNILNEIYFILSIFKIKEKPSLFKIAAQAFEAGDFLKHFLKFEVFEIDFLIKLFLIKKRKNR